MTVSDLRYLVRKCPVLHRPLQWLNRRALPALLHFWLNCLRLLSAKFSNLGLVTGSYSEFARLQPGLAHPQGRVILIDQGSPTVKPDSPLIMARRAQHLQQPFPFFWTACGKSRLIGPGLALINRRKQIAVESVYGAPFLKSDPAYWHFFHGNPTRLEGPWTSLVSRWTPSDQAEPYAHWILDALPRLAVLNELPPNTRIIVPPRRAPYQVESLRLLGLLDRCRWTHETYLEVEDYYFVSPPSMIVCYSPFTVDVIRSLFLSLADSAKTTPKRFFVRRKGSTRNMVNEAEVLDFFAKAGWGIVDLADLSFAEQIAWFANAEAIAAIHGSGLANVVWSSPACKILEIFCDQYIAGDTEWIAQCIKADYYWLYFPSDHRFNAIVDLNRVRATLESAGLF